MCYSCANACTASDSTKPYQLKFNVALQVIDVHCPCESTSTKDSTRKEFAVMSGTQYETGNVRAWTAKAGNLCLSQKCAKGDMCITTKSVTGLACGDVPTCKNTKPGDACKSKPNVMTTLPWYT